MDLDLIFNVLMPVIFILWGGWCVYVLLGGGLK
jgi:hypothetical protein